MWKFVLVLVFGFGIYYVIKRFGLLDLMVYGFIGLSLFLIGGLALAVLGGEQHG